MRGDISLDIDGESSAHDVSTAETIVKYNGYLKRQQLDVERSRQDEARPIPRGFPYERIPGLSREIVQRFGEVEPCDPRPSRSNSRCDAGGGGLGRCVFGTVQP